VVKSSAGTKSEAATQRQRVKLWAEAYQHDKSHALAELLTFVAEVRNPIARC
jgi:hypothetical protein